MGACICAGKEQKWGGLEDKFGGGNMIIEALAPSVVSSAKPPSTAIPFQMANFLQAAREEER